MIYVFIDMLGFLPDYPAFSKGLVVTEHRAMCSMHTISIFAARRRRKTNCCFLSIHYFQCSFIRNFEQMVEQRFIRYISSDPKLLWLQQGSHHDIKHPVIWKLLVLGCVVQKKKILKYKGSKKIYRPIRLFQLLRLQCGSSWPLTERSLELFQRRIF